jgi:gamma-glutamyltranspeptidase
MPALATTLERIAREGANPFYHGTIADEIDPPPVASSRTATSRTTTHWRYARAAYRGFEVFTMPPPTWRRDRRPHPRG